MLSRILFYSTVSPQPFLVSLVEERFRTGTIIEILGAKINLLIEAILEKKKMGKEAMSDVLKFTFNILLHYPKVFSLLNGLSLSSRYLQIAGEDLRVDQSDPASEQDRKLTGDSWSSKLDG